MLRPALGAPDASVGDGAFAALYRAEHERQVRRAFLLTGSNETANDVVHDAFVALHHRFDELDHPASYLNRAVLNGCRDVARRRRSTRRLLPRLVSPTEQGPEHDILDDALATLPFNQRAAVVLRFYAQLSHHEIADALDCPIGSVGPWITRGLATLRKELT